MDLKSIAPEIIPKPAKIFLLGVIFNGLGNGVFNVVIQLYFVALNIGGSTLGSIFMMNALSATLLTIPMGILADRYGKKKLMYVSLASTLAAIPLILFTQSVLMYKIGFLVIGVSNAAFVVYSPIYSSFFEKDDLDAAFGFQGALNIATISLGSLLGFIPPLLVRQLGFNLTLSYWYFLVIGALFFIIQYVFYIWSLQDFEETHSVQGFNFNLESKNLVFKISMIQLLSATSVGIFFSLFPFYVNNKFGLNSDSLGALFFASYLLSAAAQAFSSKVSSRLGTLKTMLVAFGLAAPFYLLIPFAPSFHWLSLFYVLRLGFSAMATPLFSSILMKDISDGEKATANSIRMMAMQGGSVIGPWIGGILMEKISLEFPALVGGSLYVTMAIMTSLMLMKTQNIITITSIPSIGMPNESPS